MENKDKAQKKKKICPHCKSEIKEVSRGFCQTPRKKCKCVKSKLPNIGFGFMN